MIDSFYLDAAGRAGPARFVGLDNYRGDGRRPGVLAGALRTTSGSRSAPFRSRSRWRSLMALWVNEPHRRAARFLRLAYFTPTVLPMIAVANIWLFFYTPQYGLLEQITGAVRLRRAQLARHAATPRSAPDRRGGLEGGRLLHDLLSGGAAGDLAAARRGGGARRRVALVLLPPRARFRC